MVICWCGVTLVSRFTCMGQGETQLLSNFQLFFHLVPTLEDMIFIFGLKFIIRQDRGMQMYKTHVTTTRIEISVV